MEKRYRTRRPARQKRIRTKHGRNNKPQSNTSCNSSASAAHRHDEAGKKIPARIRHTRLAFWDCPLDETYAQEQRDNDRLYTEAKSENRINRISGEAKDPRQTERVPAGAKFRFKLTLKQYDGDDDTLLNTLLTGLKLLEWDSLGGSGSRGYGKVRFDDLKLDGTDISRDFTDLKPFA